MVGAGHTSLESTVRRADGSHSGVGKVGTSVVVTSPMEPLSPRGGL